MRQTWRLAQGEGDGEDSIVLRHLRDRTWELEGIVRLDITAADRIERIVDYQHCPWMLTAGSIVVRESVR